MAKKTAIRTYIVSIAVGITTAGLWIYFAGGVTYLKRLEDVSPAYVVPLLFITAAWALMRFVRWQFLLRRADIRIPVRRSLTIFLASLVGTATPAYVGEIVRSILIRRKYGVPIPITTSMLVFERLLDVAVLALLALLTATTWGTRGLMTLVIVVACVCVAGGIRILAAAGVSTVRLRRLLRGANLVPAVAITVVAWTLVSLTLAVAATSLDVTIPSATGIHIFSYASIVGGLTLMPAGIGTAGSFQILRLQEIGVVLPQAVVIVSILRLCTTAPTLLIGLLFLLFELRTAGKETAYAGTHFDDISEEYEDQFSQHIWNYLLKRRMGLVESSLDATEPAAKLGLDLGCGLGLQCLEMTHRGYDVVGVDPSQNLLQQAARSGCIVIAGDALKLPFSSEQFDFVYSIGVIHHLPGVAAQIEACAEVRRVLKPDGLFVVQESNPRNPFFRFYMGYVFPVLRTIDEGTEWWVSTDDWERFSRMKTVGLKYFTFMPDFMPRRMMKSALLLERFLEAGRLQKYSAHYMVTLRKDA